MTVVKAQSNNADLGDRKLSVEVNFGKDLEEAKTLFGEDAVFNTFKAQAIVKLQAFIRTKLGAVSKETNDYTQTDAAIEADIENWALPTGSRQRVSKLAKIEKLCEQLGITGDQKEALLAKAREQEEAPAEEVEEDNAE